VADANIEVDVIIQNISKDGKTDFSFTVHRNDYAKTIDLLNSKVVPALGAEKVVGDPKICKVSIVGIGMRSHVGVAAKMFSALADANINIEMISTSEIKVACIIKQGDGSRAVKLLHKAFGLEKSRA
jgi:aspartate kinase